MSFNRCYGVTTGKRLGVAGLVAVLCLVTAPITSAQDAALHRLNESPRHHEWIAVQQGDREVHSFLVFPEVAEPALAVVVIHENRGLTDWVRSVADQLAEAGYIAIAPDLLSGKGPDGGKTSDFADDNAARDALYQLDPDQITADLKAVMEYVAGLDACNGKVAVAGFCWGGLQTFRFASAAPDLAAAFVFYGSSLEDPDEIARIECPVYGFYGGNDARITAGVPATAERMEAAGKTFEHVTYEGAGHGFVRSGEEPEASEANRNARDAAWERWLEILATL